MQYFLDSNRNFWDVQNKTKEKENKIKLNASLVINIKK